MCLHAPFSHLPWSSNRCQWPAPSGRTCSCDTRCTTTIFGTKTQVFPGYALILQQIHSEHVDCTVPSLPPVEEGRNPRKQHLRQRKASSCHQSVSRTTIRLNSSPLAVMPLTTGLGQFSPIKCLTIPNNQLHTLHVRSIWLNATTRNWRKKASPVFLA